MLTFGFDHRENCRREIEGSVKTGGSFGRFTNFTPNIIGCQGFGNGSVEIVYD